MEKNAEYTSITQKELDSITVLTMSPADVTHYFYNGINVRSFADVLERFAEGRDLKTLLVDRLCEYDSSAIRDNVRKKVSNWLAGRNRPNDRDELIRLCFALGLDEENARRFMTFCIDGDFHLRNPKEVAFLYCLRSGKSYPDAVEFISGLPPINDISATTADTNEIYTEIVDKAFSKVHTDNEFLRFYEENLENFGRLHNTAYEKFMEMFDVLIAPDAALYTEDDKEYPVETAVELYLRMNLPLDKKKSKYTAIQKTIRNFWPNSTVITNMRNRKEDVSRKVLLLLYVVTEGLTGAASDDEYWLEDLTPVEVLEEHSWKIDLMLEACGVSRLDPRNPFDWLILYSLKVSDDDDAGMSERLSGVLSELFPQE